MKEIQVAMGMNTIRIPRNARILGVLTRDASPMNVYAIVIEGEADTRAGVAGVGVLLRAQGDTPDPAQESWGQIFGLGSTRLGVDVFVEPRDVGGSGD